MPKKYKYAKDFTYEGKRYKVRGDTLEELYTKKALKLNELKEGSITDSCMTVSSWAHKAILLYKTDLKDISKDDVEYRIERFILPYIGDRQLKSIKQVDCMEVLSYAATHSDSHISKVYTNLNFIFRTAVQNELIARNPMDGVKKPKGRKGKRRSITDEERTALIKVSKEYPQFNIFLLMLYCGCRPSEAMSCTNSDITDIEGVRMLHIRGTKTANSDRLVPLPDELYDALILGNPDEAIARTEKGRKYNKTSYNRTIKRLRREMNIAMGAKLYRNQLIEPLPLAKDFVPYDLRHTFCTDLCRAGVDVRIAQKLMGHSNISTTVDIYTHVGDNDILKAARLLENWRGNV